MHSYLHQITVILTLAAESMQHHHFAQWNTFLCFPNSTEAKACKTQTSPTSFTSDANLLLGYVSNLYSCLWESLRTESLAYISATLQVMCAHTWVILSTNLPPCIINVKANRSGSWDAVSPFIWKCHWSWYCSSLNPSFSSRSARGAGQSSTEDTSTLAQRLERQ